MHPDAKISKHELVAVETYVNGLDKNLGIKKPNKNKS